eukprot:scaffold14308_cov68-Phaeocystis_antarctica.AAC.1
MILKIEATVAARHSGSDAGLIGKRALMFTISTRSPSCCAPRRRLAAFFCRVSAPVPSDACPRAARLCGAACPARLTQTPTDRSERKLKGRRHDSER